MDKLCHISRPVFLLFVLSVTGLLLPSCSEEGGEFFPETGNDIAEGYMRIQLDLPDLHHFEPSNGGTKAMDNNAEREIDKDLLHILVFKCQGDAPETFYYIAPVAGSITYENDDRKKAVVTVKLVKSTDSSHKFRIVVVANHSLEGITMKEDVTRKEAILEELTFAVPGKWNADESGYTPFPMWGETETPVEITENIKLDAIYMHRALARIDVGLDFKVEGDKLSEYAQGLAAFKIKEVKVYRTNDKGFVAPLETALIYTQPSIPSGAVRRADNAPLEYEVPGIEGADQYIREIYVPETELPNFPSKSNMHCIVVGGYYKGSTAVSHYRLNFNYYPVLRNHRYIFNIIQVTGPGYATAEEALNSDGFVGNIGYELIVWDESIHEVKVIGNYYFGLDSRNVKLAANAHTDATPNSLTKKYQTNYPLGEDDPLRLEWKNSSYFDAEWNKNANGITISAKEDNVSNSVLSDTLFVTAGPITIPVLVQQAFVNFNYNINCSSVKVNGIYTAGKELLENENTITLTIIAEDNSIIGKGYIIETEDLSDGHGIRFRAEGIFRDIVEEVVLKGSGTLGSSAAVPFDLRINTNSSSGAYCESTITPVSRKLRILVFGDQHSHGYNIALTNAGANKVINSYDNFGPYEHSIVKTAGFELINANYNTTGVNSGNGYTYLSNMLDKVSDPVDILYITHDLYLLQAPSTVIANYLDNNGVVLVFNSGNGGTLGGVGTIANLMRAIFGGNNITQNNQLVAGWLYPLRGDPEDMEDPYFDDPILNGPFGDVRNKQWGQGNHSSALIANLPVDAITLYSTGYTLNGNATITGRENMVSGFRHKTKHLLFFGDGGFVTYDTYLHTNDTSCPFLWDMDTMFPIPHPSYGFVPNGNLPAYNSQIWCNAIAWAVDMAVNHGINSGK